MNYLNKPLIAAIARAGAGTGVGTGAKTGAGTEARTGAGPGVRLQDKARPGKGEILSKKSF